MRENLGRPQPSSVVDYNQALAAEMIALAEVYESGFASAYEPWLFRQFDERDIRRAQSLRYAAWRIHQLPSSSTIFIRDEASLAQVLFEESSIVCTGEFRGADVQNGLTDSADAPYSAQAEFADPPYLKLFQRTPTARVIFFDVLPAVREFASLWGNSVVMGRPLEQLLELRTFHDERAAQALTLFHCVWHAKRIRAMQWYHAGCRSLEEVASRCRLVDKRFQLGILYFDDFRLLVPYGEVAAITSIFASASTEIDADLSVIPVGALRRNHQECCDIDLIVTGERETLHPDGERHGTLKALIKLLRERHFITDEAVPIETAIQRLERIRESEAYMVAHMGLLPDERAEQHLRADWAAAVAAPISYRSAGGDSSATSVVSGPPAVAARIAHAAEDSPSTNSGHAPLAEVMSGVLASAGEYRGAAPATMETQSPISYWWATHLHEDELDIEDEVTWSGVVRLAGKPHRRVDIYVVEKEELPWALIYHTGSRAFVNAVSRHARRRGLYLSARGIRVLGRAPEWAAAAAGAAPTPSMASATEEVAPEATAKAQSVAMDCTDVETESDFMERFRNVHTERDAFHALGLRYREPAEREHADDVLLLNDSASTHS